METQSSHIIQSIFYSSYWDTNYKFWRLSIISGLHTVSSLLLKTIQHTQKTNRQREIKYMKILTGYIIMINHKRNHKINAMQKLSSNSTCIYQRYPIFSKKKKKKKAVRTIFWVIYLNQFWKLQGSRHCKIYMRSHMTLICVTSYLLPTGTLYAVVCGINCKTITKLRDLSKELLTPLRQLISYISVLLKAVVPNQKPFQNYLGNFKNKI